jgi:hypothetical protein
MNYKRKCEIVAALKDNERAYCFLSDEEKLFLNSNLENVIYVNSDGNYSKCGTNGPLDAWAGYTFRIHRDYVVPIEVPEGYRLVTDEEREKFARKTVIGVGMCSLKSVCNWVVVFGKFESWSGIHNYAVPLNFSFEPEVKEISAEEAMRILADKFGCDVKLTK